MTHYLITGHTGFKGAWLVMLLRRMGHRVSGFSLDPEDGALFAQARLGDLLESDIRGDIRNADRVRDALEHIRPDVVMHLAAQPLVRESYAEPRRTFTTNVMGTLNVLEAAYAIDSVRAVVIVTTDKVYENLGREGGYAETDRLGAGDPYSTSKAMADLLTQSWSRSFDGPRTAIVRGGNVIGGGDHAKDRLIPDLVRAFRAGTTARIRHPEAVRPWQHVLDCLAGYLEVARHIERGGADDAWNIGPGRESFVTVGEVASHMADRWGPGAAWSPDSAPSVPEATLLALDAGKAEQALGFTNRIRYPECLDWVVEWERAVADGGDARTTTERQIDRFLVGAQ